MIEETIRRRRTKFYTNEEGNTLYERFNQTLKHSQYFDSLVGYFRTSGFYRLYQSLENVEKIRILIGLNIDKQTYDIIQQAKLDFESQANIKKEYQDEVKKEFENSEDTEEVATGVAKFREMLASGKIEMRACRDKNIHAKVYIMRYNEDVKSLLKGAVVTGSSNFTENGLNAQYEFNVELREDDDVDEALERFETLWIDSVPISEEYVDAIETKTWLNDKITPYELYLKCLYEYFFERINLETIKPDLPDGYLDLKYQTDAVAEITKIVEDYGGVFISDVVGLGKTYIAAMYAQTIKGKVLVIAPPPIIPNWEDAFKDFGMRTKDYKIESSGKIDKLADEIERAEASGEKTYDYVFVDEAHKFRNGKTKQYEALKRICLNKKVVLISATPLNNTFYDFYSLISLFQNPIHSDIPGVENLYYFFSSRRQRIREVEKEYSKDSTEYIDIIKQVSQEVRDKILQYIMIRRTRTDIKNHFIEDIKKKGLNFPEVKPPKQIIYTFDERTNSIFNKTIKIIGTKNTPKSEKLSYARYAPKMYLKKSLTPFEETQQKNNAGFMKSRLVKRLESSKCAFEMTLTRSIESHEKFIKMFNDGTVYISKDVNVLDYIDDDTRDIEDLLNKCKGKDLEAFPSSLFKEDFLPDLKKDLVFLKELLKDWQSIKHDFKQEKFIEELSQNSDLKDKKLVIFTESAETGQNLTEELQKIYGNSVIFYFSKKSSEIKKVIKYNYDPNQHLNNQKDDIQILITTDVLAEGINLHRSNIVINYDLPWNPTKIMQRVGRVNRVGSPHEEIFIFNFFPSEEIDDVANITECVISKIQAFHNALGGDDKYLTDDEEVESFNMSGNLYHDLNSTDSFEDKEENPQLKYLDLIKKIKENDPILYVKIADLPKKIRVAKKSAIVDKNSLVTFFRKGEKLCQFCMTDGTNTKILPFIEAIKYFECSENENKKVVPNEYFEYIVRNKDLFGEPIDTEVSNLKRGRSNLVKVTNDLKGLLNVPTYTHDEKEYIQSIISALGMHMIPDSIIKDLSDLWKKSNGDLTQLLLDIRRVVPDAYLNQDYYNKKSKLLSNREVVLSEFIYSGDK